MRRAPHGGGAATPYMRSSIAWSSTAGGVPSHVICHFIATSACRAIAAPSAIAFATSCGERYRLAFMGFVLRRGHIHRVRPNRAVNADAPVQRFYLASGGGGAPVTLVR